MTEKINRRAFLSKCFKSTAAIITLTACGKLTPFTFAQDNKEIQPTPLETCPHRAGNR